MIKHKRYFILIFLLLLLVIKSKCAIYIPFKIIENYTLTKNNVLDIVKSWKELKLYSELMIGEPPNKIGVIFVTNIFELTLFQNMCDLPNSFYNIQKSTSYNFIKNLHYIFNKVMNCTVITEKLILYIDKEQKHNISIDNVVMVYSDNKEEEFNQDSIYKDEYQDKIYENHPNTCLNIGFQPRQNFNFGGNANFIRQIKAYKVNNTSLVNSYDYFLSFPNEKEGYLIIGEKPHELGHKKFKEEQYFLTAVKNKNYSFEWMMEFNSIYYTKKYENNNTEFNRTFDNDLSIKIDLTYGLVEGTNEYDNSIRKDFFDKLINNNNCFIEENENEGYKFYYCDKKSLNYIQKNFPTLKFCINEYGICFEFGYKELFKEKNDKIYFLVYFNTNKPFEKFSFGQIIIEKYSLTFNYDTKMIGFYNINFQNESKEKNKKDYYTKALISAIIIGFILFFIAGFFLGKKIYDKTKKQRANELNDDYDYISQEKKEHNPEESINN